MGKGRILLHGAMNPVTNMAIDEALARACDADKSGFPVIRFYWWDVPTLSLGAKERLHEAADVDACKDMGIALVRRPTGGRSVLHDKELTYSIIAPLDNEPFCHSVEESYRKIAEAQANGLKKLGVDLTLTPGGQRMRPRTAPSSASISPAANGPLHLPCFAAPSRYELTWNGKKVIGSAQRRLRNSVLQHGSILQQAEIERLARATKVGDEGQAKLANLVIGIEEILGKPVTREQIQQAMLPELESIFPVTFATSDLTEQEWAHVRELEPVIADKLQI